MKGLFMYERDLAEEQREAAARDKADGWVSVFLMWIPFMLLSVVIVGAMYLGMYAVEHGTIDFTQPIVRPHMKV
ncbi:hypothetical protein [Corynebacterium sp.]|uniref:hypothetical protein n=1 Tax=Corynebacterium sp. TaxID=1720 RepID=UPI0026DCF9F0|nr:hypothetical protein [Corynebacterium sp.]MDO5031972.1 hypothetical protein [Corynebacterium sp.]